jgi:F-type H+-transporting ATPase subunit beta
VELEETVQSFREVVEGKHDDLPEQAFYMVGGIDDAKKKARSMSGEETEGNGEESEDREEAGQEGQQTAPAGQSGEVG